VEFDLEDVHKVYNIFGIFVTIGVVKVMVKLGYCISSYPYFLYLFSPISFKYSHIKYVE